MLAHQLRLRTNLFRLGFLKRSTRMANQKARGFGIDRSLGPDKIQCYMLHGKNTELVLLKGSIVEWEGDAIVNAANESLLGGGGVDGAIHQAAGPSLLQACMEIKEIRPNVRCPTGEARLTPGFRLPAGHVIHTVGPIYSNDAESQPLLESTYKSCLEIANQNGFHKIAFPAISCGVYGYPIDKAAEVSLKTVSDYAGTVEEIHFILFGQPSWRAYVRAADSMFRKIPLVRD